MEPLTIVRVVLSLAVVLGVIWWAKKRLLGGKTVARLRKEQLVTVVGRQSLGKNASVIVLDTDGRRLLLGVTEQQVTVLRETEAPAEPVFEDALNEADKTAGGKADIASAITFKPVSQGLLNGSILSPAAWKQVGSLIGVGTKK